MERVKQMLDLQGEYILATPLIMDQLFEKSIVFLTEVQKNSAYGFFVDFYLQNTDMLSSIVSELNGSLFQGSSVYLGGPISTDQIFILHSDDEFCENSYKANDFIFVTKLDDALTFFKKRPVFSKILVGYCEWHVGQLEKEIKAGYWLTIPFYNDLLFKSYANKWNKCLKSIDLHPLSFSSQSGVA